MDEKRKLIRTEIKNYLLKFQDSIHCLVDKHIVIINGEINLKCGVKVFPAEITAEIIFLGSEGFFEKAKNEDFKYYVKGDISKIV